MFKKILFQIKVAYKSYQKNYPLLTPRRRHLSKSIARGCKKGLIDQCFSDPETHQYILQTFEHTVRTEMTTMCSDEVGSLLRSTSYDTLKSFRLAKLIIHPVSNMILFLGGRS